MNYFLKLIRVSLICTIFFSFSVGLGEIYANESENNINLVSVNEKVNNLKSKLLTNLYEDTNISSDEVVDDFFSDEKNKISGEDLIEINDDVQKNIDINKLFMSEDSLAESLISDVIDINDSEVVFYKNGVFSVETKDTPQRIARATTANSSATKNYYSWVGLHLFTVSVSGKFSYNGSKASYHSGFDAYSRRGTLSIWQVNGFSKWKEASGTSYTLNCSGNFHYGFEIHGVGLVVQDFYIKHVLKCSKNGSITKNYYMY